MPIFNKVRNSISGYNASRNDSGKNDLISDIVKKLKEGKVKYFYCIRLNKLHFLKAGIKDVFVAVDNEGDGSGTISIDEFSSFVRRLGK